jgi:hypothetical protein
MANALVGLVLGGRGDRVGDSTTEHRVAIEALS